MSSSLSALLSVTFYEAGDDHLIELVHKHLHLEGNAWFNLYLVGAAPRDFAGPLSLMHVN
jgi:hypothetical protein